MEYVLSKVIGTVQAPGWWLLAGLTVAAMMSWTRRYKPLGRILLTGLVLAWLLLLTTPVQPWLTETLERRFPVNPPLPAGIDGIIILGGAIDPRISETWQRVSVTSSGDRLIAGAQLAHAHPEAKLLYTGGDADPSQSGGKEAPLAAALLADLGISTDRLLIEDRSRNTYENALFSKRLISPQAGQIWILITSARHMPRSVGIFRKLDWPVIAYPVDFQSGGQGWANVDLPVERLHLLFEALHEWAGLAYYHARGWTDRLFPGANQ